MVVQIRARLASTGRLGEKKKEDCITDVTLVAGGKIGAEAERMRGVVKATVYSRARIRCQAASEVDDNVNQSETSGTGDCCQSALCIERHADEGQHHPSCPKFKLER